MANFRIFFLYKSVVHFIAKRIHFHAKELFWPGYLLKFCFCTIFATMVQFTLTMVENGVFPVFDWVEAKLMAYAN